MRPTLEQLEPRDSPATINYPELRVEHIGNWDIVQVNVPQDLNQYQAKVWIQLYLNTQVALSQFGMAPAWEPNRIYEFNVGDSLFTGLTTYPPITITRSVVPVIGDGQIPIIFAPNQQMAVGGIDWERAALNNGWWNVDPQKSDFPAGHVYDVAYMPTGPNYGQTFAAPNMLLVDWMLINGFVFSPYEDAVNAAFSPWF